MKELTIDAMVKIGKVDYVKETYAKSTVYQVASETFYAKDTFREMLIKHNFTKRNMTARSLSDNENHQFINTVCHLLLY